MAYLVIYDLNAPDQDYSGLYDEIKQLDSTAFRIANSVWIVHYSGTATEIRNFLSPAVDEDDKLIIIKCSDDAAWQGLNRAVDFLLRRAIWNRSLV